MQTLKWVLFLLCLSCCSALMFSSLRDNAPEPQGKVPCGGHFRTRQNLLEHTQGWFSGKWLWLAFVIMLYVIMKFRGNSENKDQNPTGLQRCSVRGPLKKNQNACTNKDYAFNTLTELEMDLVKMISRVRNLKVAMAAGIKLKLQSTDALVEPHNNITIYEIWGEDDSE